MANKFNLAEFMRDEQEQTAPEKAPKDEKQKKTEKEPKKQTEGKADMPAAAPRSPKEPQNGKKRKGAGKNKLDGSETPLTRLNMVITEENHAYIMAESKIRKVTASLLVNQLIDDYRKSARGYIDRPRHEQLRQLLGNS